MRMTPTYAKYCELTHSAASVAVTAAFAPRPEKPLRYCTRAKHAAAPPMPLRSAEETTYTSSGPVAPVALVLYIAAQRCESH